MGRSWCGTGVVEGGSGKVIVDRVAWMGERLSGDSNCYGVSVGENGGGP